MKKNLLFFLFVSNLVFSQKMIIPLYDAIVPGLKSGVTISEANVSTQNDGIIRLRNIVNPTLTVFTPKNKVSDAAVVICPGGGYYILAWDHEGTKLGEWFAQRGVTAFVLKYRLPQTELFENSEIRPLQDVQQAFRLIRKDAEKYKINPNKIGVMGFSAGGHLAATASTHFYSQVGEIADEKISVRPDFSILIYPVISFSDKFGHTGSRDNLIGKNPTIGKIEQYSNELHVKSDTPPSFLVHAFDDWVNIENSIRYYKALKKYNIPSELHLFDSGGHGFSLKNTTKGPVADWHKRLEEWMKWKGWMN